MLHRRWVVSTGRWANGTEGTAGVEPMELAGHKRFTIATDVAVYFCDSRSPWQRSTNDNTNGLLRQYFPRQTDL